MTVTRTIARIAPPAASVWAAAGFFSLLPNLALMNADDYLVFAALTFALGVLLLPARAPRVVRSVPAQIAASVIAVAGTSTVVVANAASISLWVTVFAFVFLGIASGFAVRREVAEKAFVAPGELFPSRLVTVLDELPSTVAVSDTPEGDQLDLFTALFGDDEPAAEPIAV